MTGDSDPLHVAMVGTRGVPAAYGGFETAVEEIGARLVARGHRVTVYCRGTVRPRTRSHRGMRLVHLPALKSKAVETLSHTGLSVLHLMSRRRPDAALLFNAANSPFLPLLRLARVPVAVHVDGLEWRRGKWGRLGRLYYRKAEEVAVRYSDALIADAVGIADYYRTEFDASTELLVYGAAIQDSPDSDRLAELGLERGRYHLVVARFEPENHVDVIVRGFAGSSAEEPLVVVGSAPYAAAHTASITSPAQADPRIRLLGGMWDQGQLDQLYANALTYIHGHSVGGTNPSLLRAMGSGTAVIAWDVSFNREVLGTDGTYFSDAGEVSAAVEAAEADRASAVLAGSRLRERARVGYDWDRVTDGYEDLARRLGRGYSIHAAVRARGRRSTRAKRGNHS